MLWTDKLKLNKQLGKSLTESGLAVPKDVQLKTLVRIGGGQDLITIAPEGSGKTTTCIISALNKFRQGLEDAPRVLMLVADKERVLAVLEQFKQLNKNSTIQIVGLYAAPGMEAQLNALADGADIVVATPDRARAIYLKLALNLNKIQLLILDDADLIVKQGLQLPVVELANSIQKCQHLAFTEVMHDRLAKMLNPFMENAASIEIEVSPESKMATQDQILYHVPNFKTKLNLLNVFLEDQELFTKVMVIVNSPVTADKIFQTLKRTVKNETIFFKHQSEEAVTTNNINEFLPTSYRILLAVNTAVERGDIDKLPFVIHFDLPEEKETYIERVIDHEPGKSSDKLNIVFVTDLEISLARKVEAATGTKIPVGELPEELKIETDEGSKPKKTIKPEEPLVGAAFHEKKASNAKTRNYRSGEKARMTKKKKYG